MEKQNWKYFVLHMVHLAKQYTFCRTNDYVLSILFSTLSDFSFSSLYSGVRCSLFQTQQILKRHNNCLYFRKHIWQHICAKYKWMFNDILTVKIATENTCVNKNLYIYIFIYIYVHICVCILYAKLKRM